MGLGWGLLSRSSLFFGSVVGLGSLRLELLAALFLESWILLFYGLGYSALDGLLAREFVSRLLLMLLGLGLSEES